MNEMTVKNTEIKDLSPAELGGEIRLLTAQARRMALSFGIQIGYRLKIAHEKVGPHGWADWLKTETDFSAAAASRFEKLYEGYGAEQGSLFGVENKFPTLEKLSISNALRLLAVPEEERETVAAEVDAEHLSARELEKALAERDEAKAKARRWEETAGSYASQINDLNNSLQDALQQREEAERELQESDEGHALSMAEKDETIQNLRRQVKDLKEKPTTVAVERDEEAIRQAAENARREAEEEAKSEHAKLLKKLEAAEKAEQKAKEEARKTAERIKTVESATESKFKADLESERQAAERAKEQARKATQAAEELRKQLAMSDADTARFKVFFEGVQREWNSLTSVLREIRGRDAEKGAKLLQAAGAALAQMQKGLEG